MLVLLLLVSACRSAVEIRADDIAAAGTDDDSLVELDAPAVDVALPSVEIYESIRNAIVYVQAPDEGSAGSGIVIDGGWVITNAHVVDRFEQVRLGNSEGDDLGMFSVQAVDWVLDLAVVGPVDEASLTPIERGSSAALSIGSKVLLIGFPDEDSAAPTPTLTEGIVSRRRSLALGDFPFLQVDATIAPGQSGGALVDTQGRLMGMSGLEFGEGEFGLVFEADAMWPRVEDLLSRGRAVAQPDTGVFSLSGEIGPFRSLGFGIEVDESGELDISASSPDDISLEVLTLGGRTVSSFVESDDPFRSASTETQLYVDEALEGGEDLVTTVEPGLYQVLVRSFAEDPAQVEVTSSNLLHALPDIEEGQQLPVAELVEGSIDWVRDSDRWELPLTAGDQVVIEVDGIVDTVVVVRLDEVVVASSDDTGSGLFGTGSLAEFTADETATYVVEIGTFDVDRWGYLVRVDVS